MRAAPPGSSLAENRVTAWPRAAATHAASSPARPAPTTTTRFCSSACGGRQPASSALASTGFWKQRMDLPA